MTHHTRTTSRLTRPLLAVAVILALGVTGVAVAHARERAEAERTERAAVAAAALREREHAARIDADVALYEGALRQDSASAIFRTQLAVLYLERARSAGDHEDYVRAEALARESLSRNTHHNGRAFVTLAASLLAQHRFAEAAAIARQLAAGDPEEPQYQALLGETLVELGDYEGAAAAFAAITTQQRTLPIAPRLARWAEVRGRSDAARIIMRRALADARARNDLSPEQRAWFALRLGDLELRAGKLHAAEERFREGLAERPNDPRLLGAMARLSTARREWREAVTWGERAVAVQLDPGTLGVVSEAYLGLGDSAKAAEYAGAMEVAASGEPGAYHRGWALFLLDHDRQVPEVLAAARADIRDRRDIHGYDLLAWALHKSGRIDEARAASAMALRTGTDDAALLFRAGMIARAAGDPAGARQLLRRALEANPVFHPTHATVARAVLDTLDGRN